MKKLIATVCVLGTVLTLAACSTDGSGHREDAPFATERTAGDVQSERVFRRAQSK